MTKRRNTLVPVRAYFRLSWLRDIRLCGCLLSERPKNECAVICSIFLVAFDFNLIISCDFPFSFCQGSSAMCLRGVGHSCSTVDYFYC